MDQSSRALREQNDRSKATLHVVAGSARRPIRVLHVVWNMGLGGLETYLIGVLRRIPRSRVAMDFLVHSNDRGHHEDEIERLGGRIFRCPEPYYHPYPVREYLRAFRRALRDGGPYDILHCHYEPCGPALLMAAWQGIPIRLVHAHSAVAELSYFPRLRRWGGWLFETAMKRLATHGVAVSTAAAAARFGAEWETDSRWSVSHCGIELAVLGGRCDRDAWRKQQGIPEGRSIIAHVGRFGPEKNHRFLLEVAAVIRAKGRDFELLLFGDGRARASLEQRAAELGISDRVRFLGYRNDVAAWLRGAIDLLLFPSFLEGLPLAVVEAQAAGVKVVMSREITEEATLVAPLVRRLSVRQPAEDWAEATLRLLDSPRELTPEECFRMVASKGFDLDVAAPALETIYERLFEDRGAGSRLLGRRSGGERPSSSNRRHSGVR